LARIFEHIEKVTEKLTKDDKDRLMHQLDHCLLMANKFYETNKPEYYVGMKSSCQTFIEMLDKLEKKAE